MNPPEDSNGKETPKSSPKQPQSRDPRRRRPPATRVNRSQLVTEPSHQPLHAAGGRRLPPPQTPPPPSWPSSQRQHQIQHPRQPPLERVYNFSDLISEPWLQQRWPLQHPLGVNQESHIIKKPSSSQKQLQPQRPLSIGKQSHIIGESSRPLHAAGSYKGKEPVIIYEKETKKIHVDPMDIPFQALTGLESSQKKTSGDGDNSPVESVGSVEDPCLQENDRQCRIESDDGMAEVDSGLFQGGQFRGIPSPTPTTLPPITPETPTFMHDQVRSPPAASYGLPQVPNRGPLRDNGSPSVPENTLTGRPPANAASPPSHPPASSG